MLQDKTYSVVSCLLDRFITEESLPASFKELAIEWYLPLFHELNASIQNGELSVLGVAGTQGSGKSTLSNLLQQGLQECFDLRVIAVSMDDFYLSHQTRKTLAAQIHPLLQTRGVPGTHDAELAMNTIKALLHQQGEVAIPRFDKATDDRKPKEHWDHTAAPVDLVILEGWCVCAPAQPDNELADPINELERTEDRNGAWRHFVNEKLKQDYQVLFDCIDQLILLQAPSFDAVYRWRGQQEEKLKQSALKLNAVDTSDAVNTLQPSKQPSKMMDEQQLRRFIQHYERLTLQSLKYLPSQANIVFTLNEAQQITQRINN